MAGRAAQVSMIIHDIISHIQTHDKNNTTNDHTKEHPPYLTTIEGGATTVRTTSHTRVGGRAEVSVAGNRLRVKA